MKQKGSVRRKSFISPVLGVEKAYTIYLPPGYEQSAERYPVLYLFRGHEKEWFDRHQDGSRGGTAVQDLADDLIAAGKMRPMLIIGVGLTSENGELYGLGVNFVNPPVAGKYTGVGNGQFESYIVDDLISHVDQKYRTIGAPAGRAADGFSLGGYTAVMLAVKHPGLFVSVGSYDGSHMFRDLRDPRLPGSEPNDGLWFRRDSMFSAAFRRRGDRQYDWPYMLDYNPLNMLDNMTEAQKDKVRQTRFYIRTAAGDGMAGNRDRSMHLMTLFNLHGIPNRALNLILGGDALHTWKYADMHLRQNLPGHSDAFGKQVTGIRGNGQK